MAAKKAAAKKKSAPTFDISLTASELEMLRDIFGVVMPVVLPAGEGEDAGFAMGEATVAEFLAAMSQRTKLEHILWKKVAKTCSTAGVETGAKAPTFAVSAAHVPAMHVYKLED